MNKRFSLLSTLLCSAALLFGAADASAQLASITVEFHDTLITTAPGASVDFHVTVRNISNEPAIMRVLRTLNDLPDANWLSAICTGDFCWSPDVNDPDPVTIPAGGTMDVKLSVTTGNNPGQARASLMFDQGFGSFPVAEQTLTTVVAVSGIEDEIGRGLAAAYPNPATSIAILPVSVLSSIENMEVKIYSMLGREVASFNGSTLSMDSRGGVSIDVSDILGGTYFYQVTQNGRRSTGRLVVGR